MRTIDQELVFFRERLCSEVGLSAEEVNKVATLVAADIRFLPIAAKNEIKALSPVPLIARIEELTAQHLFRQQAIATENNPAMQRAAVIARNYVCFVYLKDACFEVVSKYASVGSVAARCTQYLSRGLVRDFRNAFSHANWHYNSSFTGVECWVLEDARNRNSPLRYFQVSQNDLDFWQALSLAIAYATYEQIRG